MSVKGTVSDLDNWLDRKLDRLPEPKAKKKKPGEYDRGIKSRLQRAQTTIKSLDDMGDRVAGRMSIRGRKRGGLENFYDKLLNRPALVIFVVVLITGITTIPATAIITNMRGDLEIYLPVGHPATITLAEVNKDWTTDAVVIYVETRLGLNVTNIEVLKEMSALEGDDNNVNQTDWKLRGADWARGDEGLMDNITSVLSISSAIKTINATPSNLSNAIHDEFPNMPKIQTLPGNYSIPSQDMVNKYVSQIDKKLLSMLVADKNKDGIYDRAAIVFMIKRGANPGKIVAEMEKLVEYRAKAAKHPSPVTVMTVTGAYTVIEKMQGRTIFEFLKILPFLILFLVSVLLFFHRNWKVIPITLTPVLLALGMTLGLTGLVNWFWPSTFIISPQIALVIPVLLALGIAYGLYVSNRFVEEAKGTNKEKMIVTVKAMNNALLLSAITEFIGFASLMVGTLPPIFTMGFSLSIGIILTYVMTMIVTPPLVMVLGYEKKVEFSAWNTFAPWPSSNRKKIIAVAMVLTLISAITIPLIKFDADYLGMMPKDDKSVVAFNEYSRVMSGGMIGMIIVRAPPLNYDTLDATDKVETELNHVKYTTCLSVVDLMKMVKTPENITIPIGQGFTFTLPADVSYWDILQKPGTDRQIPLKGITVKEALIAIFYGSLGKEMNETFINPEMTKMLLYVFMPNLNVEKATAAVSKIDLTIDEKGTIPSLGKMSHLTGMAPLIIAINDLIIQGQFQTLALSIFMCWALLAIWFRSWKLGLMTMIPCILVISYEPATLVMMNIPLSIVTVMIGSIAIGTGVDFSIQITQRLNLMGYGIKQVVSTVEHMGVSFVEATTTMVLGFSAVLLAPWPSNTSTFGLPFTFGVGIDAIKQFVIMIMLLLIFNAICALFVLPALYTIMIRFRESESKRKREMAVEARRLEEDRDLPAELEEEEPEAPEMTVKQKVKVREEEEIPKIY